MRKVLIVGSDGNMGRRYKAVFRSLQIPTVGVDLNSPMTDREGIDGILIATPTPTHLDMIYEYSAYKVPILCEKPISLDLCSLTHLLGFCRENNVNLTMVNQYRYIEGYDPDGRGPTYYNYWNTGKDGIPWDLISVVALAKGEVTLGNDSPVWMGIINGKRLHLCDMDQAYINMIRDWAANPIGDLSYIESAHKKVHQI